MAGSPRDFVAFAIFPKSFHIRKCSESDCLPASNHLRFPTLPYKRKQLPALLKPARGSLFGERLLPSNLLDADSDPGILLWDLNILRCTPLAPWSSTTVLQPSKHCGAYRTTQLKFGTPNIAQHSCPSHASPLAAALLPCASCAGNCEGSLKRAAYALSEVACQFGVRLDGVSRP